MSWHDPKYYALTNNKRKVALCCVSLVSARTGKPNKSKSPFQKVSNARVTPLVLWILLFYLLKNIELKSIDNVTVYPKNRADTSKYFWQKINWAYSAHPFNVMMDSYTKISFLNSKMELINHKPTSSICFVSNEI